MRTIPDILDIHTHRPENGSRAIVSYSPLNRFTPEACLCSVGAHPWELTEENAEALWNKVRELCASRPVAAIGETGLDKLSPAPMELQLSLFRRHVELSETLRLPLIIHCVKAMEELLSVKKESRATRPWIWHGFRGKPEQARQLLRQGLYLSFGERYSEEAMRATPAERLFIETDESALDIETILRRAAEIRETEVETLRKTIRENIRNVFFSA